MSVSNKRSIAGSRSSASSPKSDRVTGRAVRYALLASTALVGVFGTTAVEAQVRQIPAGVIYTNPNDDNSFAGNLITFAPNMFGYTQTQYYVSNNGGVQFYDNVSGSAYFNVYGEDLYSFPGRVLSYGESVIEGRNALIMTWDNLGYYSGGGANATVQGVLFDRSDTGAGNWDFEFNYASMRNTTVGGDISSPDGSFTVATGNRLTGSNVGTPGRWVYNFRSSIVGDITGSSTVDQLNSSAVNPRFDGGTLTASAPSTVSAGLTVTNAGGTVNTGGANTVRFDGSISDDAGASGGLTVTGGGRVILGAGNTYTGGTWVNGAVLQLNTTAAAGAGVIHMVDPTIDFAATGTYANAISLEVAGGQQAADPTVLNNSSGGGVTLTGRIYETAGVGGANQYVTFAGGNTTVLTNGANAWGGVTTVNPGVNLQGTTGSISGGSIVNNGTLTYVNTTSGTVSQNISGSGQINVSGLGAGQALTFAGNLTNANGIDILDGSAITNTGSITAANGPGVYFNAGGGTLVNAGTITGDASATIGYGVQNAAASGLSVITNQAGGVIGGGTGSILLNGAGNTDINLQAGSTTNGQILSNAGGTHNVIVAGILNGAYNAATGSGVDNITLASTGSMTSASLGAGNDSFLYQGGTFSGLIDGGSGTDGFTSNLGAGNSASINMGNLAGFETYAQQAGALTLTGTHTATGGNFGWTIANNASLTLAGAITTNLTTDGFTGQGLGSTLTVNAGASFVGFADRIVAGTINLINNGTLDSTRSRGAEVDAASSITNNTGAILRGIDYGLLINGTAQTTIFNAGLIQGTRVSGLQSGSTGGLLLTNSGTITSDRFYGVSVSGSSIITNSGVISAGAAQSDGRGLATFGGVGTITNQAGGVISGLGGGITLFNGSNYVVDLQVGSTVNGGVLTTSSARANLTVAGILNGGFSATGSGADVITLAATGAINGNVSLGAGNDSFIWQGGTFSGLIDGGTGTDVFRSVLGAAAGSTSLNNLANFETYNHESGSLTLTGARSGGPGWHLLGGTLTLNGSLTNTGVNGVGVQTAGITVEGANSTVNIGAGAVLWAQAQNAVQVNFVENFTLNNSGTVGGGTGFAGVRLNRSATINNLAGGLITSSGVTGASGISNSGTGVVVNNASGATITGNAAGIENAFGVEATAPGLTVYNSGSITTFGTNTAAIFSNSGALDVFNLLGGTISGPQGVSVTGGAATIYNFGTISGGVSFGGSGLASINNYAGGVLEGNGAGGDAIRLFGSNTAVLFVEEGSTVTGDIDASGHTGSVQTFLQGAFNGAYIGGSDVDNFNLYSTATGAFTLDGGAGTSDAVNFVSTGDSTRGGPITNFEIARFDGTGTVTLTGTNTGFLDFFVNSGTVSVSSAANMGDATGRVSLYGGSLQTTASFVSNRTYLTTNLFGQPGRIDVGAGTTLGIAGGLQGNGDLILGGAGTLNLLTTNSGFSGDILVNGSALRAGAAGAFGTGTIHLINPTLIYGASGTYANNILLEVQSPASSNPSTLNTEAGVTAVLTGAIAQGTGAGVDPVQPLVIGGAGRVVLTNTGNSWAGTTTINAGATLQGATNTISGSNTIANGVLALGQPLSGTFSQNVSGAGTVQVFGLNANETLTLAGALTNANGVQVTDASSLTVTGSIASSVQGIQLNAGGSVTNSGVIHAGLDVFEQGVFAAVAGSTVSNLSGGVIDGWRGVAFNGAGSATNSGTIRGLGAEGVSFFGGAGTVTNLAGGIVSGFNHGVYSAGGSPLTVVNSGQIHGGGGQFEQGVYTFAANSSVTNNAGGLIDGWRGVTFGGGATGASLVNAGTITGTGDNAVSLFSGGLVDNLAGGVLNATSNGGWGVYAIGGVISVTNAGLINADSGVVFNSNGFSQTLSNIGSITGLRDGVMSRSGGVSITNGGSITATSATLGRGIALVGAGNIITNQTGGAISGWRGVELATGATGTTIGNAGTISGSQQGVYSNAAGVLVNNTGTITASAGQGVYLNAGGSLTNSGLISGSNHAFVGAGGVSDVANLVGGVMTGGAFNAVYTGGAGSVISNAGVMNGGNAGVYTDGAGTSLTNSGTIRVTGTTAPTVISGVYMAGTGSSVINSGLIESTLADGRGVFLSGGTGSITNQSGGVISGNGAGAAIILIGADYALDLQTGSTVNGLIDASASTGANTLTLAGTLNGGYVGGTGADDVTLIGGATLAGFLIGGDGLDSLVLAGSGDGSLNASLTGGFESRILNGTGSWTLSGMDSDTSNWTLNAGELRLTGGQAVNNLAGVAVNAGAILSVIDSEAIGALTGAGSVVISEAQALVVGADDGSSTFDGVISGLGGLQHVGSGTLTLTGVNTYTGLTLIQSGTLQLGASDVIADASDMMVLTGATLDLQVFDETVRSLSLNGTLAGTGTLTAVQYQLDGATVNANLGAGDLVNIGGASTLSGTAGAANVFVQGGTLTLGASDRLADTATVSVASGATFDLGAFNDTVALALLNGTLAGTGTLTAGQYQLNGATVDGNLGAGDLFNVGGVSTLTGTAGAARIWLNAGTLRLGASGRLSDTATVSVASGATFALNGFDERIGALFGTGDVNVGSGRLTFGGSESGFGGRLSGTGSLVHTGSLFTLVGDHTIRTISNTGGELRFLGSTTGNMSISGGSLTGAGTIGGALTASNGAILSPGLAGVQNGIGGFTAGSLTLNGATLAIDVLGRSGGSLIDQLRINGTATLTGGLLSPTFHGGAADFDFSTRYLFLQANNLVGTFANGGVFTASAQEGLFWRVRYDLAPNGAVLELRELTDFDPGLTGSGNERAVGQALSQGQLEASDDFAGILSLIAGLDDAGRTAAFNSISGESLAGMSTSLLSASNSFLASVRDGGLGTRSDGGALNFAGQMGSSGRRDSIADRVGAVISDFDPSASAARGAGGWVTAYAADQTLEGKPGTADIDSRLNGFGGGYGVRNGAFSIGGAAGVTRLEGEVLARQAHYESDLSHAAAYVSFDDGVWAADVTASIYGGDLDSRRGVTVGTFTGQAIGNTHAEGQAISASVARRFQVADNTVIALGAVGTASNVSVDGFTETGAGGLSLQASGLERDWQSLLVSARGTQDYRVDGRRFRIYAGAGVLATTGDRQATGDMRFTGAPTGFGAFTVEAAETPPVAGVGDFGLAVGLGEGLTLSAGYRGVFGERLRDNQIGVQLKANW